MIGSPDVILGAITSPEQDALRPQLEALVAMVEGVVDHVVDVVGGELIADYPMLTEALRRRRVEAAEADRFVERLFGLELSQATYDRGSAFVRRRARAGRRGRACAASGTGASMLPTPRRGRRPRPLARPHRPLAPGRATGADEGEGGLVAAGRRASR